MKTINWLALSLLLMGTTQGYTATTDDTFIESESFAKRSTGMGRSTKDKKNDKWSSHQKHHNQQIAEISIQGERGPKGDQGETGEKGEQGEKGDAGESFSIVHGYYHKSTNDDVTSKAAIVFDVNATETGELNYDSINGALVISEDGSYQIHYYVDALTENSLAIGVQLNDEIIVPGSVYRVNTTDQYVQLHGSVIVKLNKDDTLKIVNLSENDLHFDNSIFSQVNASLSIKKLN